MRIFFFFFYIELIFFQSVGTGQMIKVTNNSLNVPMGILFSVHWEKHLHHLINAAPIQYYIISTCMDFAWIAAGP